MCVILRWNDPQFMSPADLARREERRERNKAKRRQRRALEAALNPKPPTAEKQNDV